MGFRPGKESKLKAAARPGIPFLLCCMAFFMGVSALAPGEAIGFWPFTQGGERYVARVGSEVITREEYLKAMNALHTTNRVGKELSRESSFEMQNYRKFLDELIDVKLMKVEAENLSLDKRPEFAGAMKSYILNLILQRLNEDEIRDKVTVEELEIEAYYREKHKDENSSKEEKSSKIPMEERESIKAAMLKEKTAAREKEYFAMLREKADIRVDTAVLEGFSEDKGDLMDKTVAEVNGEIIPAVELVVHMKTSNANDTEEGKRQALDRLILHKLLDQEAMRKGYAEEEELKKKITKYRDELLVNEFKLKVILPSVAVGEEDVREYYEKNRDQYYRNPDRVDLGVILVPDMEKAEEILAELEKGADFSYLAMKDSIDSSREKGGSVGWTSMDVFPKETREAIYNAKKGDLIGPFAVQGTYAVMEFRRLEKGDYRPLDEALKVEIDRIIGREKFNAQLKEYLTRLRGVVPVKINKKELNLVIEGR